MFFLCVSSFILRFVWCTWTTWNELTNYKNDEFSEVFKKKRTKHLIVFYFNINLKSLFAKSVWMCVSFSRKCCLFQHLKMTLKTEKKTKLSFFLFSSSQHFWFVRRTNGQSHMNRSGQRAELEWIVDRLFNIKHWFR